MPPNRIHLITLVTCLPTYRTMAYFKFLSQFYCFHLTHLCINYEAHFVDLFHQHSSVFPSIGLNILSILSPKDVVVELYICIFYVS
jgi:hypothetical protein